MFTDTVGFTTIAEQLEPRQLIDQLDANSGFFDTIATRNKIERIKTIGDAYMAAAGVPEPTPTHAAETAELVEGFFVTQPRGKIPAKNKGEIEMFLVTAIHPGLSRDDAGTGPDGRFWQKHRQLS